MLQGPSPLSWHWDRLPPPGQGSVQVPGSRKVKDGVGQRGILEPGRSLELKLPLSLGHQLQELAASSSISVSSGTHMLIEDKPDDAADMRLGQRGLSNAMKGRWASASRLQACRLTLCLPVPLDTSLLFLFGLKKKKKKQNNQLERLRGCTELRLMNLSGTQWRWENASFLPPPKQLDEGRRVGHGCAGFLPIAGCWSGH